MQCSQHQQAPPSLNYRPIQPRPVDLISPEPQQDSKALHQQESEPLDQQDSKPLDHKRRGRPTQLAYAKMEAQLKAIQRARTIQPRPVSVGSVILLQQLAPGLLFGISCIYLDNMSIGHEVALLSTQV
ncbi:hypothetical protein HDV05_007189 [Chytridiales sp. JEL 0842]|nr:hypothetical protein HDV05_007189 [Chytridiales sp. JEL 0842]